MATEKLERIYTVNLSGAMETPRTNRAPKAVEILRKFIARHMKARDGIVTLSNATNAFIWSRSMQKPPRRIKVRAVKEDGNVMVTLLEEKQPKLKFALKKRAAEGERKAKAAGAKTAKPVEKTEVKKAATAQAETQAPTPVAKPAAQKPFAESRQSMQENAKKPVSRKQI